MTLTTDSGLHIRVSMFEHANWWLGPLPGAQRRALQREVAARTRVTCAHQRRSLIRPRVSLAPSLLSPFPPFSSFLSSGRRAGGDGGWAKTLKGIFFLVPSPKTNPARAGWLKRLGLIRPETTESTPWSNFVVVGVQLCLTITTIFPCVALSYKNRSIFQIITDYWPPQKRSTIWIWVQLLWAFGHFELQHWFLVPKNCTILFFFGSASIPSWADLKIACPRPVFSLKERGEQKDEKMRQNSLWDAQATQMAGNSFPEWRVSASS